MEVLYETLDLLDQYEKERKNTISMNSTTTIVQKEDNKDQNEEVANPRESTTESNITRINSTRSSNSFEARTNSDVDDTDVESDEEFKSFPDESSFNYQTEKENIKYDANYYEYINQKNSGMRITSLPVSDNHMVTGRSRSSSSLSTPELLIYDSNDYDSSSSYGSLSEKMKFNQSFTYGSSSNIISNLPKSNKIANKSLSGNKIFQNNQLMDSCETLLNDMENNIEENISKRSSNSSSFSGSSSSDFLIPQRGISLLDSTRKARHKSFAGPSNPSPIPSPAIYSPRSKYSNIKTNNQKDIDDSQSDSSKTIPSSPSTPNEPFIGVMSRSFSVNSSNAGNMSFSNDYNVRPISSLYRNHSLGSHDKRFKSSREAGLKNRYSTYDTSRSRSVSPNQRKPSLSVLPGNINANGGVIRGISSSTPPVINYSEGSGSEFSRKDSLSSPLSQTATTFALTSKNTPPSPYQENLNKNLKDVKVDLPHTYTSKSSIESENNVKEAGSHVGQSLTDDKIQNGSIDRPVIDNVNVQNLSDNLVGVQNSTNSIQSFSTNSSRLNSNDSTLSNNSNKGGRLNSIDIVNNGLLSPRSINSSHDVDKVIREKLSLPVSKRKSSIPKQPILYQEPFSEMSKPKKLNSTKDSEKEVFDTLIQLLDQLESNQNQTNQGLVDTTATDASLQEALNHLEKSYFPEGREKEEQKLPLHVDIVKNSPMINSINENDLSNRIVKMDTRDGSQTPTSLVTSNEPELKKINMNSPARIRGQEELQRILNNSAPSLHVKSKKERAKQHNQYKLLQLQQKQELRIKKIQQQQQQQQQQQLQNHLKQQISQKLQQNAIIQQKLKQFGGDPNLISISPDLRIMNPDNDYNSPISEISINDIGDSNPRRYDSITPLISPVSTYSSMDNLSAVSISTRPRKSSFNNQQYVPVPIVNNGKDTSMFSNSYESTKEFKYSPGVSSVNSSRISPNQSFTSIPIMVPSLGHSPSVQSKSFSVDITNENSIPSIQQQKLYSRSPSAQCVDISSSLEAKKQRKSKKTSIFYIPPDNSSKPLSAVVSDVSDVSINNELDTVTKNNTIINSNSNAAPTVNYDIRASLYKNGNYNLSADNLPMLKEKAELNYSLKKSNSYGSKLNNYGIVDERQVGFKKIDIDNAEGETFIERFMNELNVTTGFENNILKQRAQQQDEERREMKRRTLNFQNQDINTSSIIVNIPPSFKKY